MKRNLLIIRRHPLKTSAGGLGSKEIRLYTAEGEGARHCPRRNF